MKLTYRGSSYEIHPTEVRILDKNNTVLFRHSAYSLNSAVINLKQKPQGDFVYRGITSNTTEEKSFLGNSYNSQNIRLCESYQ